MPLEFLAIRPSPETGSRWCRWRSLQSIIIGHYSLSTKSVRWAFTGLFLSRKATSLYPRSTMYCPQLEEHIRFVSIFKISETTLKSRLRSVEVITADSEIPCLVWAEI